MAPRPLISRAIRNAAAMMRANEFGDSSIPPNSLAGPLRSGSGPNGGEGAALSIATVLACVKALHDDLTSMPFRAYTGSRKGAREELKNQPQIVEEPFGPDLPPSRGMGQIVVSRVMRGDGFVYVVDRDRNTSLPTQLMVLHPDAVTVDWKKSKGKFFRVGMNEYGPDEIIQFPTMMLPGSIRSIDMLTYQRLTHDLAWKVNTYADAFFGNGGSPSGVITVPGNADRKKVREVKDGWEANHAGVTNAHRPAVLTGGATWQALTVTPENAQFLQTRMYLREEICGIYSVPLHRINAIVENTSQGGGKGLDAMDSGYVKHGLLPNASGIEEIWDGFIPGGGNTFTMFDLDVFLRASAEIRASVAQIHRVTGVRTRDEIRAEEGWAPLPDGKGTDPDAPLNSNVSPAGGASNSPKAGNDGSADNA